ncbi:MAG: hypothetical protein M1823_003761, partial [Watsoniomyces obsoletus]
MWVVTLPPSPCTLSGGPDSHHRTEDVGSGPTAPLEPAMVRIGYMSVGISPTVVNIQPPPREQSSPGILGVKDAAKTAASSMGP